ncbi:MAG: ArsR/SmtB family transcription factor [Promethearchaeota archaeon]
MTDDSSSDEGVLIIPLSSTKIKAIAQALSNETAVNMLQVLADKPMSAQELSDHLGLPLTTVKYNIDQLLAAELIKVEYVRLSQKMREMKYYAAVKRALIFAPEKDEKTAIGLLKKLFPSFIAVLLSIPVGLLLRELIIQFLADPHEITINPLNLTFYTFVAGVLFAVLILLFFTCLCEVCKKSD